MAKARTWSPVEDEWLLANHKGRPMNQLSIALARAPGAVKTRLQYLGKTKGKVPKNERGGTKQGKRKDLDNLYMRSGWEADCSRYFNFCAKGKDPELKLKSWEYEPRVFYFDVQKRGAHAYMPDFLIHLRGGQEYWVEVKGYLRAGDRSKIKRFKKFYPEEFAKLVVIVGGKNTDAYKFFKKVGVMEIWHFPDLTRLYGRKIPHWES